MRYGVFSDVHGNYEALKVVLEYLDSKNVHGYICCGDLVGYGPEPDRCVKAVSGLPNLFCVIGNHDQAALGQLPLEWFNSYASEAINFTIKNLSEQSIYFLERRPQIITQDTFTLVHGSPKNPTEEYLLTGEQYLENIEKWHTHICFIGHSHVPVCISRLGVRFPTVEPLKGDVKLFFQPEVRFMINPGSVGQPRDRNPKAACGIFDSEKQTFELVRLDYPKEITQELMREKKLPELLVERIGNGW